MGNGQFSMGWGEPAGDSGYNNDRGDGDSGENRITEEERLYRFRFQIPKPNGDEVGGIMKRPNLVSPGRPVVKRVLFLYGDAIRLWEHNLWLKQFPAALTVMKSFSAICLQRNGYRDRDGHAMSCPMCAKNGGDSYPTYKGFFPVIDMGQVEYKDKAVVLHHESWTDSRTGETHYKNFPRVLLAAPKGSEANPGLLTNLKWAFEEMRDKYGIESLKGTVWDAKRTGAKKPMVGDMWAPVMRRGEPLVLKPENFAEYLAYYGAKTEDLQLDIPDYTNDAGTGVFDIDPQDHHDKLARLVGLGSSGGHGGGSDNVGGQAGRTEAQASGAGFGGENSAPRDDDNIPF